MMKFEVQKIGADSDVAAWEIMHVKPVTANCISG